MCLSWSDKHSFRSCCSRMRRALLWKMTPARPASCWDIWFGLFHTDACFHHNSSLGLYNQSDKEKEALFVGKSDRMWDSGASCWNVSCPVINPITGDRDEANTHRCDRDSSSCAKTVSHCSWSSTMRLLCLWFTLYPFLQLHGMSQHGIF